MSVREIRGTGIERGAAIRCGARRSAVASLIMAGHSSHTRADKAFWRHRAAGVSWLRHVCGWRRWSWKGKSLLLMLGHDDDAFRTFGLIIDGAKCWGS